MRGILNSGNTCYMNSLLQCLLSVDGFANAVEEFPECRIQTLFSRICTTLTNSIDESGQRKPISARPLLNYLQTSLGMDMYTQHDIHEILMLLLSSIHSMVGNPIDKQQMDHLHHHQHQHLYHHPNGNHVNPFKKIAEKCTERFYQDNEWKGSFITSHLCGQIIKQIVCGHCDDVNHNFETFTTFQLDILNEQDDESLDTSLRDYFRPRMLHDWKCEKCEKSVPSEQRTYIWHLPRTLLVCLSRFQMTSNHHTRMYKNNKLMGLPNILEIPSEYFVDTMQTNRKRKQYTLSSVACHHGSLSYGHYTSIVRDKDDNKTWYHIDDDVVSDCSKEISELQDTQGYLSIPDAYLIVYNSL